MKTVKLCHKVFEIRHYRIVGEPGACLNELKNWLKFSKEVKSQVDVQNLITRIMKQRSDANLLIGDSGEVGVESGVRRRSLAKE